MTRACAATMSRADAPLISVLIPCYNAEKWVGQAIESALAQTWQPKEVIVVDDGSTDGSLEVIRSFGNRIRYEAGPNRGANAARNRLLELSRGEWLQYLDADDYLLNDKITGQLVTIPDLSTVDVVISPMTLEYWAEGRALRRVVLPVPEPRDASILLARWLMPGTHAVLLRRAAVVDVGGWNPAQNCCQEHELYLRLLMAAARFAYSPQIGAIYRQWSSGTISKVNPSATMVNRLRIIDRLAAHLQNSGGLTPDRSVAIAHSRLECARILYGWDRQTACHAAQSAYRECPGFRLPRVPCFPWAYRVLHRALGFAAAEKVAGWARRSKYWLRGGPHNRSLEPVLRTAGQPEL